MKDFLANATTYEEFLMVENFKGEKDMLLTPFDFNNRTFDYYCEKEEEIKTFETELDYQHLGELTDGIFARIPDDMLDDGKLNYTFYIKGKCRSCKNYHIDLLLNIYSKEKVETLLMESRGIASNVMMKAVEEKPKEADLYARKIGVLPERKVEKNKLVSRFFDRESDGWYYKGISCIEDNYGIGAFAYFRRIIEKELIHIIEAIKDLPDSHELEIQELLDEHKKDPTVSTIYENIFKHLPSSLKELGDNPIKLLYKQTSEGLHSLEEEKCLDKSKSILALLNFVVTKINSEKSEIKQIKETIKGLKRR